MIGRETHQPGAALAESETMYYARYDWCLNPLLTLRELFQRLNEELDRSAPGAPGWRREETVINSYLFVCAVACTTDDFLAARWLMLRPLIRWFPGWKKVLLGMEYLVNLPWFVARAISLRKVFSWRAAWNRCLEEACALLIPGAAESPDLLLRLRSTVRRLASAKLPENLTRQRMKLHEGFRCQDLTHHDVFSLINRVLEAGLDRGAPVTVAGIRTAGTYFAPLAATYLTSLGYRDVSWITLRPKVGVSPSESRALRSVRSPGRQVIVIDDYPNTGTTLILAFDILRRLGFSPAQITFAAPVHPAESGWIGALLAATGSRIVTLGHDDLYKHTFLKPDGIESLLAEYLSGTGFDNVAVKDDEEIEEINRSLRSHYADGFQSRVKRVFRVELRMRGGEPQTRHLIAKSVGWGWLGYHAFIAASRLAEFVPSCIGLRHGLLFSEWLHGSGRAASSNGSVKKLAAYVAARSERLALEEDPRFGNPVFGWGWLEIVSILRRAYGVTMGRLADSALLNGLSKRMRFPPTLVDGKMRPEEWLDAGDRIVKVDFEQHNFGAPEMDIVDPAYDLAGTVFEFGLPEDAEGELLNSYESLTGDRTARDRIILYKLLYASIAMRRSALAAANTASRERGDEENLRYVRARDYAVGTMNRFSASFVQRPHRVAWSPKLLFLDVDGILDSETFGFPHTTPSGANALSALIDGGYSVILNTGRSIAHVRTYCSNFGIPGGVAEYGSVFVDTVRGREIPLIDSSGAEQLSRLRALIKQLPGVFVDPDYRYSLRAYRYRGARTEGLTREEVKKVLSENGLHGLVSIQRADDTTIVQRGISKGMGVRFVKQYLHCITEPVAAMGDSDQDIGMLYEADLGYSPRNCSRGISALAQARNWKIMKSSFQRGLLAAVEDLLLPRPLPPRVIRRPSHEPGGVRDLLADLLKVAEKPRLRKLFLAMSGGGV